MATRGFQIVKKTMDCILLNLAVVNFLSSIVGGGVAVISNGFGYFILGPVGCSIYGFLVGFFGVTNIMEIALLSFTRYMIVCQPGGANFSVTHAKIGIVIAWVWSFLGNLPLLAIGAYEQEGIGTSCGPRWDGSDYKTTIYLPIYFILCLVIPLVILGFSYGSVLRKVWTRSSVSTANRSGGDSKEKQATTIVVATMVAFFIAWGPYTALSLHSFFLPHTQINPYVVTMAALFAKASPVLDPCVYFLILKEFRRKAKMFVKSCIRCTHQENAAQETVRSKFGNRTTDMIITKGI